MTEIIYTISDGYGEISAFSRGVGSRAKIRILGVEGGRLHIGELVYELDRGAAEIDLSRLCDGDYLPLLVSDEMRLELEGVRRFGRELLPLPTSEKILRRLLLRVRTLEERLASAEGTIAELSSQISRKILL